LFFGDVFVRRVLVNFAWVPAVAGRVRDKMLRRQPKPAPEQTIERLRSRKAAIAQEIDQRRAAARFEPTPDAPVPGTLEPDMSAATTQPDKRSEPKPDQAKPAEGEKADDEYTRRLLEAKKKFRGQRKDDSGPGQS